MMTGVEGTNFLCSKHQFFFLQSKIFSLGQDDERLIDFVFCVMECSLLRQQWRERFQWIWRNNIVMDHVAKRLISQWPQFPRLVSPLCTPPHTLLLPLPYFLHLSSLSSSFSIQSNVFCCLYWCVLFFGDAATGNNKSGERRERTRE